MNTYILIIAMSFGGLGMDIEVHDRTFTTEAACKEAAVEVGMRETATINRLLDQGLLTEFDGMKLSCNRVPQGGE